MRRILLLLSVILLIGFSASFAQQNSKPTAEAAPAQIPADADWRDASSISKMTDGDLFYIITNGREKMVGGEGDGTKETLRWELVNYVRLFGNKGTEAATSK